MNSNNPRRWHFILFVILSVVAIAQLSWWVIFQVQEGNRLMQEQLVIWGHQISVAKLHMQISGMTESEQTLWLAEYLPDLEFTDDHADIVVTGKALENLERRAKKHVRMFVSEGAFFSLLVLAGIWFLYWALRERLQIERRTDQILASASAELSEPLTSLNQLISNPDFLGERNELHIKWLGKMANNIQLISGALSNMRMARLIGISKRRIPLRLTDFSAETTIILENHSRIAKALGFEPEIAVAPGISLVTNLERWELIVSGLLEIATRIPGSNKRLAISLSQRTDAVCFEAKRFGGDPETSTGGNDRSPSGKFDGLESLTGLDIVRNLVESINGRLDVSRADNGSTILLGVEFPRLYDEN